MKLLKILGWTAGIGTAGLVGTCNYFIDRINPEWYTESWNELSDSLNIIKKQPRYFQVNANSFICPGAIREMCVGAYVNNEWVLLAKPYVNNRMVVEHEQLHALGFNEKQVDSIMEARWH